jgi:FkbM family methyltransferase
MAHQKSTYLLTEGKNSKCYYVLNSKDFAVARRIYIGLDDEHLKTLKAIQWIKSLRGSDIETVLDIGANIGHISIPLLKEGLITNSYMWEPDVENFKLLQCNILLNNCINRVKSFNVALGDKAETILLELSEDNFGDHRVRVTNEDGLYAENKRKLVECTQQTLDYYLASIPSTNNLLMWMDVQGYEAKVLSGAIQLLSTMPNLVFEFWPYGLNRAGGVYNLDKSLSNYSCWYNLADENPVSKKICELEEIYNINKLNDQFYLDVLLFN